MQTILARSCSLPFRAARRSFSTSVTRLQAVPTEKPTLTKEFKIYRWVSTLLTTYLLTFTHTHQNPDEPEKKPTLQSYTIDLNQTGPMARTHPLYPSHPLTFRFRTRVCTGA